MRVNKLDFVLVRKYRFHLRRYQRKDHHADLCARQCNLCDVSRAVLGYQIWVLVGLQAQLVAARGQKLFKIGVQLFHNNLRVVEARSCRIEERRGASRKWLNTQNNTVQLCLPLNCYRLAIFAPDLSQPVTDLAHRDMVLDRREDMRKEVFSAFCGVFEPF